MEPFRMQSPNGGIKAEFMVQNLLDKKDCLTYRIFYSDKAVLDWSGMGFSLKGVPNLEEGFKIINLSERMNDSFWEPVAGENKSIRDHYMEYVIEAEEQDKLHRRLDITFRVYDQGVAFQFTFHRTNGFKRIVIEQELTRFAFLDNHVVYAVYHAQGAYERTTVSDMKSVCERPLVLEIKDGPYVALAEAKLVDYARMKLIREEGFTLRSHLTGKPLYCFQEEEPLKGISEESMAKVSSKTPLTTPWRVVMLADTSAQLYEGNGIMLNLNDPCAIADPSFVHPGKVIRETTLTTEGGMACVDFAVHHHLQYIELDAGWYGNEHDFASDATFVSIDPKRYKAPLDMEGVIRYAKEKKIRVIVYINHRAMVNQLDELLPLYKEWGIDGIKYGFVEVGTQRWTSWLHECVRKAAHYGLVLTIHDEYRPTGYQRTYPNLLTQEGIRGDEEKQPAENTLTIVFTRMLAGPADNTVCYFDPRVDQYWSHAYQLAKSVVLFSPLMFLYWYDRPIGSFAVTQEAVEQSLVKGDFESIHNIITEEPELVFFDHLVTTWDETKMLDGSIGKFVTMARRSGETWFVGAMNAKEERDFTIHLSFLEPGREFEATLYSDDSHLRTRTKVKIERIVVTNETIVYHHIGADSGIAMRIVPVDSN